MGNLTIRNLDDDLLERLKEQAKANERSMEGEARLLLREALGRTRAITAADIGRIRAQVKSYMGDTQTPATSVEDIRAWRDAEI